jgi:hypothetical protein
MRITYPIFRGGAAFSLILVIVAMVDPGSSRAQHEGHSTIDAALAKPYELPKDVFDLPEFDHFRNQGRLDVDAALKFLGELSDHNLPAAQQSFDIFAWKAFLALNWAARPNGDPDPSKDFGDIQSPRVWEFWEPSSQIFLPNGERPKEWTNSPSGATLDHFKAGWRMNITANEGKQAFSGPLIDQNKNWVHYVSLVNRSEFDYLVGNELYNLEGQAVYLKEHRVEFPQNDDQRYGAIEIKLAWKVLTPEEEHSDRFFTRRMPVLRYRPPSAVTASAAIPAHKSGRTSDNGVAEKPEEKTVGLVGMHIAMRTRSSPQWIWATFEQIDNTRLDPATAESSHPLPPKPSLSNPDDPDALVLANVLPPYNADNGIQDWDESKEMAPVEVLRLVPPPQGTARVNAEVQAYLRSRGSVFRFYELDGTQWPKHPRAPAIPGGQDSAPQSISRKMPGEVVPIYLTNATMETYFQKGFQAAGPLEQDDRLGPNSSVDTTMVFGTESCTGCHYSAGACIGFRKDSSGKRQPIFGENANDGATGNGNFSWLLQLEAKSKGTESPVH